MFSKWLILLFLFALGCGGTGLKPVQGLVTLDGEPLARASVQFVAQQERGRDAFGSTDEKGVFKLSTFKPGDGALPGTYKVLIQVPSAALPGPSATSATAAQLAGNQAPPLSATLARYGKAAETPFTQEVPVVGSLEFKLQSK